MRLIKAVTVASLPDLPASKITSGVLNVARVPNLDASKITSGAFNAARVPNLDASKITSGTLNGWRLPTGAGGVGTYGLFQQPAGSETNWGAVVAGSRLYPSAATASSVGGAMSGSWRCMGYQYGAAGTSANTTVYVRIS